MAVRKEDWEKIWLSTGQTFLSRLRVPGGWLVTQGAGLTFVPDPNHTWKP